MTSERQKAANRANALRSTGPKTAKGKAAIRLNAFRHGLLARDVVLPEEDADAFEELRNQVQASLSPVGPIEEFLMDQIVNAMWRLRRLAKVETLLFHSRMHAVKADRISTEMRSYEKTLLPGLLTTVITDETAHTEVSEALECAIYERDRDEVLLGRAIAADAREGDAFAKLSRYERSLERSLLRALQELLQLQDRRQSRALSPILNAVTLDVSGTTG